MRSGVKDVLHIAFVRKRQNIWAFAPPQIVAPGFKEALLYSFTMIPATPARCNPKSLPLVSLCAISASMRGSH